jgi:hypothetical protein
MRNNNVILLSGAQAGSFTTAAYDLRNMVGYCIQVVMSGGSTPAGSLKLQGSADLAANGTPTNWGDITQPQTSVVAIGGDGTTTYNYSNAFYRFVRVVYTATSGSTLSTIVTINAKGF